MQVNSTLVMFETCRYTLGVGGADDVVWSSVVSLRWQKEYREVLFSCFYEITKHEECICVQVCMHIQCAYVICVCTILNYFIQHLNTIMIDNQVLT